MQDPGQRRGEEPVSSVVQSQRRTARTGAGPSVRGWKASATSAGTASMPSVDPAPEPAFGTERIGASGVGDHTGAERQPAGRGRIPAQSELGEASCGLGPRGGLDLGSRQQVSERIEVVPDADPALGAGLERRRAAPREGIHDDVARARIASDERMGKGGREGSRGMSTSGGRRGPTAAAGPSIRARARAAAARAAARARVDRRRPPQDVPTSAVLPS